MTINKNDIIHDKKNACFTVEAEGGDAYLSYENGNGKTLDFHHTFVPKEARGKGIASMIVEKAINFVEDNGYYVQPSCPFVKDFVKHNPEYEEIIKSNTL